MTQVPVNIGGSANDGTGDSLRTAFGKVNANDADLDSRLIALAQLVATTTVTAALTPVRSATGSNPVSVSPADYLIVLNGPTQVFLEASPKNGATHVIKDRGSIAASGAVTITPNGTDTIDGAASFTFVNAGQAATLTYTAGLGWSVY